MEKLTKKNSILFNQLWINKAIEDGNYHFLINKKISNLSIGEIIEYNYEINDRNQKTPKITKRESLLFESEWIRKYKEEGLNIPNRRFFNKYSLGEILELKHIENELIKRLKEREKEKILELK